MESVRLQFNSFVNSFLGFWNQKTVLSSTNTHEPVFYQSNIRINDDVIEPVTDLGVEPVTDSGVEPVTDLGVEPVSSAVLEPIAEANPDTVESIIMLVSTPDCINIEDCSNCDPASCDRQLCKMGFKEKDISDNSTVLGNLVQDLD
jgi:hypothetical protein